MKKILLLLLLFSPTLGADYLDGIGQQAVYIRQQLNIDSASTKITDGEIYKYIREAYTVMAPVVAGRDIRDTVITVKGQSDYSIDSLILRIDYVKWKKEESLKVMLPASPEEIQEIYRLGYTLEGNTKFRARSNYYQWTKNSIELIPPPIIAGDTILINAIGRVQDIMSDTAFVADFPVNYRVIATTYGAYKLAVKFDISKKTDLWQQLEFQASALNMNINIFKK